MKRLLLLIPAILFIPAIYAAGNEPGNGYAATAVFIKKDPTANFWKWFKANEKRLRKFEENPNACLNELLEQVKKIRSGLAIELEPPQNGIIRMTVSADGNEDLFELVRQVVNKAPAIKGWKFIAFRQRMAPEQLRRMKLKAQHHELDPEQMKFFPVINGDTLDLIIYAKGITEENYNQVAYGGLLLLDNILGEYDCATKVRSYDFHDMPSAKEELEGLLPLLELAAYVDQFHSVKNNL
ncbi:hypothetical protein [Agriterribacter sp.]|uniref:hypothetical protein n=1 Tax=Agriterribacter sp. TaxID=2821509 RepID=UPI002BBC05B4|nr:hypothetical protein [Agriterribacter sp.]HRP57091.1 hypothetical protein [Agriterribacter sp.]